MTCISKVLKYFFIKAIKGLIIALEALVKVLKGHIQALLDLLGALRACRSECEGLYEALKGPTLVIEE